MRLVQSKTTGLTTLQAENAVSPVENWDKTAQKRELQKCNYLTFSVVLLEIEPGTQGFSVLIIAIIILLIFITLSLECHCRSKLFGKQRVFSWLHLNILF